MAFLPDRPPDFYFYGLLWPKPITIDLVTCLLSQKVAGNWQHNSNNMPAYMVALEYLNNKFDTIYDIAQVVGRVRVLRVRFSLFDKMLSSSGVHWDREVNYVFASYDQWTAWIKENPMARAFRNQWDPLYDDLRKLFTPNEQLDLNLDIIVVPDSEDDEEMEPNVVVQPAENVFDEQPLQHLHEQPPQLLDAPHDYPAVAAPHDYPPQDVNDFEALSPIEIIDINDDADDIDSLDLDSQYTDSNNEVFPLSSNEQANGEVINNIFGNVSPFSEDEVMSPIVKPLANRANASSSFIDLIPMYTQPQSEGLRAKGGPNALFNRREDGSSSSSTAALDASPINNHNLFK